MTRKLALLAAAAMIAVAPALADKTYRCTVTDMITAPDVGHDPEFEANNKRKIYTLTDRGSVMQIDVTSDVYSPSTDEYPIVSRDNFRGITARMQTSIGEEQLMFSPVAGEGGVHKATVVHQYTLFVNSWHLACKPQAAPAPKPRQQGQSLNDLMTNN